MKFYEWLSIEDFNSWHEALCKKLGYPLISINQLTGEPDLEATPTTAYTTPTELNGKVIADVEDQYADGLTETALRPPSKFNLPK